MKITALAPWFGSKRGMAPLIASALGPHRAYWEPFCGSMATLLAKPTASSETVNDLHKDLVNLARVVRDPRLGADLYRRLRRTLFHEDLFRESLEAVRQGDAPSAPDVDRAYHYFLFSWMGRNGVSGTPAFDTGFCRRFSSSGGDAGGRFSAAVESIPAWRRRLASVCILNDDGFDLLGKIEDRDGTAIYADPPYLQKGASYVHDFAEADHARLAEALRRFRLTRVVVSYYDDPRLDALYPGWTKLDCSRVKSLVNAGMQRRGKAVAPEVLLVNREAAGGRSLFA